MWFWPYLYSRINCLCCFPLSFWPNSENDLLKGCQVNGVLSKSIFDMICADMYMYFDMICIFQWYDTEMYISGFNVVSKNCSILVFLPSKRKTNIIIQSSSVYLHCENSHSLFDFLISMIWFWNYYASSLSNNIYYCKLWTFFGVYVGLRLLEYPLPYACQSRMERMYCEMRP